jgi:hypothetical protein
LKEKLLEKGFDGTKEFSCRGFDTFGVFRFIGGISKGRPNGRDLEQARNFVQDLLKELSGAYGIQNWLVKRQNRGQRNCEPAVFKECKKGGR